MGNCLKTEVSDDESLLGDSDDSGGVQLQLHNTLIQKNKEKSSESASFSKILGNFSVFFSVCCNAPKK